MRQLLPEIGKNTRKRGQSSTPTPTLPCPLQAPSSQVRELRREHAEQLGGRGWCALDKPLTAPEGRRRRTRAGARQPTGCRLAGLVTGLDLQKPPQDRPLQPLPLRGPPPWPRPQGALCAACTDPRISLCTYSHSVFSFPLDVYLDPGKERALSCPLAASEAVSTSCFSCLRAPCLGAVGAFMESALLP